MTGWSLTFSIRVRRERARRNEWSVTAFDPISTNLIRRMQVHVFLMILVILSRLPRRDISEELPEAGDEYRLM